MAFTLRPAALGQTSRPLTVPHKRRVAVRAGKSTNFDESAAQVRRLLDRDRKELNFDELEKTFSDPSSAATADTSSEQQAAAAAASSSTTTPAAANNGTSSRPMSPFGPSSSTPASPFGSTLPTSRKPLNEPAGLSPTTQPVEIAQKPWWTKITTTQIVIFLSFTTIISLMIATFFVVVKMGGVHFNE